MKWLWVLSVAGMVLGAVALAVGLLGGEDALEVSEVRISGDPRVLVVTYVGPAPPCDTSTRVTVEESESTVTLRGWAEKGPDGVCPALGKRLTADVELDEPLGDREVVDREVVDGRDGQAVVVTGSSDQG